MPKNYDEMTREELVALLTASDDLDEVVTTLEKKAVEKQRDLYCNLIEGVASRFKAGAQFAIQQNDLVGKQLFAADALESVVRYMYELPIGIFGDEG